MPAASSAEAKPVGAATPHSGARVLLVDDDEVLLRSYARSLTSDGYHCEMCFDGESAVEAIRAGSYDLVLSDIDMPRLGGLALLERIRAHDLDVPVILITGSPSLETAMAAVEHGALRYLPKPVEPHRLRSIAADAVRLHRLARAKRLALQVNGEADRLVGDRAGLVSSFGSALESLWMAYQPIVSWQERRIFGYEALLRSGDPALKNPGEFLEVAERLGRLHDLGRAIRACVAQAAHEAPEDALLFVNLHASDLNDDELFAAQSSLAPIAKRLVLEVTERASMDAVKNPAARTQDLRAMGFRIAVDDLGAGYAGLSSFMQLEPEFAKLDMSLVRGIDADQRRQSIVRSMRSLCDELGMLVVSEGVETPSERDTLARMGCDLLQGYLFAKPGRGFGPPRW
jgi:EAL domain-containing protein (putative c-di-GMP-specific phosphodiesterase class I)